MKFKRILTLVLSAVILITAFCALPFSAEAKTKSYSSFQEVIDEYQKSSGEYASIYYNYLKIKTPYGKKKALVVTTFMSAYMQKSTIYIKRKKGKIVKYKSLPGALTGYTKSRNYLRTYTYYGSGTGNYTILKYSKAKKKYVKNKSYDFDMSSRGSVDSNVNNKTKSYKKFKYDKYVIKVVY